MSIVLSSHASTRMRQRGVLQSDILVIVEAGTPVDEDSVFLLDRDVDREIRKREIAALQRLRGCRVVIAGETVVTVYRPSRKTEKRLLRGTHRHKQTDNLDINCSVAPSHGGYDSVR
jgi:hypothetical protein